VTNCFTPPEYFPHVYIHAGQFVKQSMSDKNGKEQAREKKEEEKGEIEEVSECHHRRIEND